MYMLCANHGSGQSMDCAAQSMDPCFARAIHGLPSTCAIHGLRHVSSVRAAEVVIFQCQKSRLRGLHHKIVCAKEERSKVIGRE